MLWGTNTVYGSTVSILPEFGGGSVNASELETFASRSWQRYSDISGDSSSTQRALIRRWLGAFGQEGVRIGFWEGGNTVAALKTTGDVALGVGQGALNTIDGAKNTVLAIPDLPRNVWNAGVWWTAKGGNLVGLNDGVPDLWVEGDWSVPQAEWMHTWNDDLLVNEGATSRAWSEGLGGAGAVMLLPVPKLLPRGGGGQSYSMTQLRPIMQEARALELQGLSRAEAFAAMRGFREGSATAQGQAYVFHFARADDAAAILQSRGLRPGSGPQLGGPGIYTSKTPTPNFFQRYFSPIGFGLRGGQNVRIPILLRPEFQEMARTPLLPRWTTVLGRGEQSILLRP